MEEYFFTKKSDLHFLCHLIWPRWFNFLVHECLNLTRFCFSVSYALCISRKKSNDKKVKKKSKILPTYLSYFFGACNLNAAPRYISILLNHKYVKQVVLINHSWVSPILQQVWELELCLFFKKWGRGHFSPKKREVGKIIEEWRLLKENKFTCWSLCL